MKAHNSNSVVWLAAALILVVVFGTTYATTEQSQRNAADWPQLQIAEDAAAELNNGQQPHQIVSKLAPVNISSSLAPFLVVYDQSGRPIEGSGRYSIPGLSDANSLPLIPIGALQAAQGHDYHRVTWQPNPDLRFAAVTVAAKHYYVMSARSLKPVEHDEKRALQVTLAGGLASWVILAAAYCLNSKRAAL